MGAGALALLGLIGPLRHGCVPFPRSTFAFRALHTRTAGVPPACARRNGPSRSDRRFYRRHGVAVKLVSGGADVSDVSRLGAAQAGWRRCIGRGDAKARPYGAAQARGADVSV